MRILVAETADKQTKTIVEMDRARLLEELQQDHGWHEVIPMYDSNKPLRVYFDIDAYDKDPEAVLGETLTDLNAVFHTTKEDWAIASCHRDKKVSFHLLSRRYKCSLRRLRDQAIALQKGISWIDLSAYWFSPSDRAEEGSLRLPNQSKGAIHKEGPPFLIEQGDLSDFLVTDVAGLATF